MGINEATLKNVNSGRCGSMNIVVRAAQVAELQGHPAARGAEGSENVRLWSLETGNSVLLAPKGKRGVW